MLGNDNDLNSCVNQPLCVYVPPLAAGTLVVSPLGEAAPWQVDDQHLFASHSCEIHHSHFALCISIVSYL